MRGTKQQRREHGCRAPRKPLVKAIQEISVQRIFLHQSPGKIRCQRKKDIVEAYPAKGVKPRASRKQRQHDRDQ